MSTPSHVGERTLEQAIRIGRTHEEEPQAVLHTLGENTPHVHTGKEHTQMWGESQ